MNVPNLFIATHARSIIQSLRLALKVSGTHRFASFRSIPLISEFARARQDKADPGQGPSALMMVPARYSSADAGAKGILTTLTGQQAGTVQQEPCTLGRPLATKAVLTRLVAKAFLPFPTTRRTHLDKAAGGQPQPQLYWQPKSSQSPNQRQHVVRSTK